MPGVLSAPSRAVRTVCDAETRAGGAAGLGAYRWERGRCWGSVVWPSGRLAWDFLGCPRRSEARLCVEGFLVKLIFAPGTRFGISTQFRGAGGSAPVVGGWLCFYFF